MKGERLLCWALPFLKKCQYVSSDDLQRIITIDSLMAGSQKLQSFADANGGNRVFGSKGHNATVDYLYDTIRKTDYYEVIKQPFTEVFADGSAALSVNGKNVSASVMTYTPAGTAQASLIKVADLGCDVVDYPVEVKGQIAFVSRGTCPFQTKAVNGKAAGATAVIVYNNVAGELGGTLGTPFGDYVPIVGISLEDATIILEALEKGPVQADLKVDAVTEERVSFNVIAETKGGDHNNVLVLGGHSDSVAAGPGINDDGSGIIGVLRVAEALTHFKVKNAVRFAFWSAEEFGLLGSYHYMKQLNSSKAEVAKMRAYLNFDMIASPNYILGVYDGSGDAFNVSGPPGSDAIEEDFVNFFRRQGRPSVPVAFDGRSDYAAFIENGVPSGGLFTGAEDLMTDEEARLFRGQAGVAYDVNYHKAGDNIENLNKEAYLLNTQGIANSVAKYAMSFAGLPAADAGQRVQSSKSWYVNKQAKLHDHGSHGGSCGYRGPAI